jgi:hypothetical protein
MTTVAPAKVAVVAKVVLGAAGVVVAVAAATALVIARPNANSPTTAVAT